MNNLQPITMHLPEGIDIAEARTLVLRQVDRLADWIAAQCQGATQIKERPVMRDRTAEDFANWPVAWLVSLSMDLGQPEGTRCAAGQAIGERFLADDDVEAEVIRVANRIALDRASDERADDHERRKQFARVMDAPALSLAWGEA